MFVTTLRHHVPLALIDACRVGVTILAKLGSCLLLQDSVKVARVTSTSDSSQPLVTAVVLVLSSDHETPLTHANALTYPDGERSPPPLYLPFFFSTNHLFHVPDRATATKDYAYRTRTNRTRRQTRALYYVVL